MGQAGGVWSGWALAEMVPPRGCHRASHPLLSEYRPRPQFVTRTQSSVSASSSQPGFQSRSHIFIGNGFLKRWMVLFDRTMSVDSTPLSPYRKKSCRKR